MYGKEMARSRPHAIKPPASFLRSSAPQDMAQAKKTKERGASTAFVRYPAPSTPPSEANQSQWSPLDRIRSSTPPAKFMIAARRRSGVPVLISGRWEYRKIVYPNTQKDASEKATGAPSEEGWSQYFL